MNSNEAFDESNYFWLFHRFVWFSLLCYLIKYNLYVHVQYASYSKEHNELKISLQASTGVCFGSSLD